jgi:hypothetical protein
MKMSTKWFSLCALLVACGGGSSEGGGTTAPSATASTPATATTSAAPTASATPTQTAAPTPPPLVVIAMKLTGILKGSIDVKEDGTVLKPDGKPVAKFVGNELRTVDGGVLISVAADGTMTIAGSHHGTKFDDKDDLVVEGGAKFHVADDGTVMLFNEDGKADKDSGKLKIVGFKPQGRRAATVLVMGMLTPANPSAVTISATANPSVPPPKK